MHIASFIQIKNCSRELHRLLKDLLTDQHFINMTTNIIIIELWKNPTNTCICSIRELFEFINNNLKGIYNIYLDTYFYHAQSCLTLCIIMDSCPLDSSAHGIFLARKYQSRLPSFLLQVIFPTQGSNPRR